ncbi:hypothetical protein PMAYCL1PPCAC_02424, partial [Pristionchus mayeri]
QKTQTDKPKKLVMPREDGDVKFKSLFDNLKKLVMPREEKEISILPYTGKESFGSLIRPALEKLRAGRGLINIERIDRIDVKVYTYQKKNEKK